MIPAFHIKLNQQILPNLAVIGKFDGKHPSLACATTGGRVLLHAPHEGSQLSSSNDGQLPSVRYLNFNRKITAMAAGKCISGVGSLFSLFISLLSLSLTIYLSRSPISIKQVH